MDRRHRGAALVGLSCRRSGGWMSRGGRLLRPAGGGRPRSPLIPRLPPGTSWALMDAPRVAPPWMAEVSGGDTEVCCELISEDGVFFMDVEPK